MNKLKLNDTVQLKKDSIYANNSFQQEGFGHLKIGEIGIVIKVYDNDEYLIKFIDEKIEKSNIYKTNDIKISNKINQKK